MARAKPLEFNRLCGDALQVMGTVLDGMWVPTSILFFNEPNGFVVHLGSSKHKTRYAIPWSSLLPYDRATRKACLLVEMHAAMTAFTLSITPAVRRQVEPET